MTALDARPAARELGAPELAGYRVLRSLSRDERAEVLLGHRVTSGPGGEDDLAPAPVQTVALKVFAATEVGWTAVLGECAALERARGDHVVDLLDLDADEESIRLVFERLPRGDLAELLRIRVGFDAGEAVTLLAPIAIALLRLHTGGVAHGNLSARTVLFRGDGSPTLIGFSRAALFEPGAPEVVLEQVEAVRRDRASIRALATTVLARVNGGQIRAARELHDDVDGCADEVVLPLLASRLFEVAAAMAVRFTPDGPDADAATSTRRAVPVGAAVVESGVESGVQADHTAQPWIAGPRIAGWLARLVPESLLHRVLDTVERSSVASAAGAVVQRWRSWTPARRRLVTAVMVAALTVAVVTAVIPARAAGTGVSAGADEPPDAPTPSSSPAGSSSAQADPVPTDPVAIGDDPIAAAGALTSARDHCLSSLSLRCLDRVDEAGSSAMVDDQAAIRSAQQGGELPDPLEGGEGDGPPVLIERLGDSALVRVGEASSGTSLLLVKGDGGWRIRDVVAADETANASKG
jgi:hypothetical protein